MSNEQLNLFLEPTEQSMPQPVDIEGMAERIGANARFDEYKDRTSDAARDQGHGTPERADSMDKPSAQKLGEVATPVAVTRTVPVRAPVSRSGLSAKGKLQADREPDREHDPTYHEPVMPTDTKEMRDAGRAIAEAVAAEERARIARERAEQDYQNQTPSQGS